MIGFRDVLSSFLTIMSIFLKHDTYIFSLLCIVLDFIVFILLIFWKGMRTIKSSNLKTKGVFNLGLALTAGATTVAGLSTTAHADTIVQVKAGQSLNSIAQDNKIDVKTLAEYNKLTPNSMIHPDQKLKVPDAQETTYTVKQGDTVSEIARDKNLKTDDVLKLNNLSWENSTIYVGQVLKLKETPTDTPDTNTKQNVENQSTSQQQTAQVQTQNSASSQSAQFSNTVSAPIRAVGSDVSSKAANLALQLTQHNIPYVWGGESTSGMDCSGLVKYVYGQLGYSLPHNTVAQEAYVNRISTPSASSIAATAKPGDLLFWGGQGASYHVAIYIGDGKYVQAPTFGQNVSVGSIYAYTPQFVGTLR